MEGNGNGSKGIINTNTLVPISLVITLLVFTAYMERRFIKLESMYETQQVKIEENTRRSQSIPGTEIIYRLNKIEEKLERLEDRKFK